MHRDLEQLHDVMRAKGLKSLELRDAVARGVQVRRSLHGRRSREQGARSHDHLHLQSCSKLVEFEAIEVLQRDIAERFGFLFTGHVHELFGICNDCGRRAS